MDQPFSVTGRDVLFTHWPMDADILQARIPDGLTIDTFEGDAWVSALVFEITDVGVVNPQFSIPRSIPQLSLRTYVQYNGRSGIHFFSSDMDSPIEPLVNETLLRVPTYRAQISLRRRGDEVRFTSRRTDSEASSAHFAVQYEPHGESYYAPSGSLEEFFVERHTYFTPTDDDRGMYVGEVNREPWELRSVDATIRANTMLQATELDDPIGEPRFDYSPGFKSETGLPKINRDQGITRAEHS